MVSIRMAACPNRNLTAISVTRPHVSEALVNCVHCYSIRDPDLYHIAWIVRMVFELCSPEKCRGEGMRSDLTKLAVADVNKQCNYLYSSGRVCSMTRAIFEKGFADQ